MSNFEKAVRFVLKHEGGLVKDLNDPGGTTKFGISQKAYPDLDIESLTEEDAKEIYRRDYWNKMNCDKMEEDIAIAVFDSAVNCGVKRAGIWLQIAINRLMNSSDDRLMIDGIVGKKTIKALNKCESKKVIMYFLGLRLNHYTSLSHRVNFLTGWVRRVSDLLKYISVTGG